MAHLQIRSTSPWLNRARKIHMTGDGQDLGTVRYGQILLVTLPEGDHQLQARIDWCGSEALTVRCSGNEVLDVEIKGFRHSDWILPLTGLLGIAFFVFGQGLGIPDWLALLGFTPGGLLLLYHITFGRWAYLRLMVTPASAIV